MNLEDLDIYEIPTIKLTQSVNKSTGTITFYFSTSYLLNNLKKTKSTIKHLTIKVNNEWLYSNHIKILFTYGKPTKILYIFLIKNPSIWNDFCNFLKEYANKKQLIFLDKKL